MVETCGVQIPTRDVTDVPPIATVVLSGMQNVNGGRCAGPDCSKQPRFSLPGEKGKYCSKHREEGMVDVLYTVGNSNFKI